MFAIARWCCCTQYLIISVGHHCHHCHHIWDIHILHFILLFLLFINISLTVILSYFSSSFYFLQRFKPWWNWQRFDYTFICVKTSGRTNCTRKWCQRHELQFCVRKFLFKLFAYLFYRSRNGNGNEIMWLDLFSVFICFWFSSEAY